MRIWSLNPKYLDTKGLVALWRETLLAKHVLEGKTKGYRNHPQLIRFKASESPLKNINYYLEIIWNESQKRNYNFDQSKFTRETNVKQIAVTKGQIEYEFLHLMKKLEIRDTERYRLNKEIKAIDLHPLFYEVDGGVESWEII